MIHCHLFYCILMFFMKEKMLGCIEYRYSTVLHYWQKSFQHHNSALLKFAARNPVPDILEDILISGYICILFHIIINQTIYISVYTMNDE